MLKIIVKGLAGQRIRVFLTIFSIAVGVMVFVSISGLLQGLETSVYETFQGFSKNRDILVIPDTVDVPVLADVISVSTVEEKLYRETSILVKHTDIDTFEKLASITLVEGVTPGSDTECMAEYFFAQKSDISLGDRIAGYTVTGIYLHEKGFYTHVITRAENNGYTLTEMKVDPLYYDDTAEKIPLSIPAKSLSYFFSEGTVNLHKSLQQMLGIVVVILILSVFVSMNTAVLERTWEIGILRALGAQKSFILKLFLYEGVIISVAAAGFGIALGIIFSTSLTAFVSEIQQVKGIQPMFTGTVLLQAAIAPVIIGVLGSILPAYRASTMDIHECLVV